MFADCEVYWIHIFNHHIYNDLGTLLARAKSCQLKFLVSKSLLLSIDEAKSSYGDELKSLDIEQHEFILLYVFWTRLLNFLNFILYN